MPAQARGEASWRGRLALVYLFLLGLALPAGASIYAGPLRLTPYRLVLIVAALPCLYRFISGAAGKIILPDVLLVLHVLWASFALINVHGLAESWEFSGIYALETLIPYLIARCYIRSAEDFVTAVKLHFVIVVALIPLAFYESATGDHFVRDTVRAVFGGPPPGDELQQRLGLTRAYGPFEHPILYGVFCASALATAYYTLGNGRSVAGTLVRSGLIWVATFFSLSAGPLMAYLAQAGLIGWEVMTRGLRYRWVVLAGLGVAAWTTVSLVATRTPIVVFIWYFTFSVHNAYTRILIWRHGSAEVVNNPFFGIGLNDWQRPEWMPPSIDNFWLVEAMRYGLPGLALLAGAIVIACIRLSSVKHVAPHILRYRTGILITVVGLTIAGATVHFWDAVFCLFMFLLGSGAWILHAETAQQTPAAKDANMPVSPIPGRRSPAAPRYRPE